MNIINYLKNQLFLSTNNKNNDLKFESIELFQIFIENTIKDMNSQKDHDFFSNISDNDRDMIKNIIFSFNYPRKLKPIAKTLYRYTDTENLLFCALNLCTVELKKSFSYRQVGDNYVVSYGSYNSNNNIMTYHYADAIPHEFMHMASTSIVKTEKNLDNGFGRVRNRKCQTTGLNEGYTELLSRRIYYNENYNGDSYTTNVYCMRLLELLYEKKEDMERDYFRADLDNLIKTFLEYGTKEELKKFISLMNRHEWERSYEEKIELLKFIKNIVKRTKDFQKIDKSEEIEYEYRYTLSKHRKSYLD